MWRAPGHPPGRRTVSLQVPPAEAAGERQEELETGSQLAEKIDGLVNEAQRLRQNAESNRDDRAAFRGLDTERRALQLYGKATGEISTARRATKTRADVVPTREEGVETATA
jgi:hypothetical protein